MCAATATAFSPDEQKRLTVPPGTVTGSPARRATFRPVLKPCGPSGKPVPMMTSSTSAGSSCGTLRSTSFTQWAAKSSGRVRLNDPRNDFARPVRELATMAASRMAIPPFAGWRAVISRRLRAADASPMQAPGRRGRPSRRCRGRATSAGSRRGELKAGDLARGEEPHLLPREAEAAVHVERRAAVPVEAAVETADELREVPRPTAGPRREPELPSVRMAREHQRRAEPGRLREAVRAMRQHEERTVRRYARRETRQRGMLLDAARPV